METIIGGLVLIFALFGLSCAGIYLRNKITPILLVRRMKKVLGKKPFRQVAGVGDSSIKGWGQFATNNGIHIIPMGDTHEHSLVDIKGNNMVCGCDPDVSIQQTEGADILMVRHHAFDGREAVEQAEALLRGLAEKEGKGDK